MDDAAIEAAGGKAGGLLVFTKACLTLSVELHHVMDLKNQLLSSVRLLRVSNFPLSTFASS